MSWANSSNNETGFEIIRLIQQNRKTVAQVVGTTDADVTTFTYKPKDNGPYTLYIYSRLGAKLSTGFATASCSAIGGPDVTLRLLAISSDLEGQYTQAILHSKSLAALTLDLVADFYASILAGWDITPLFGDNESSAENKGILPDGTATVTVAGEVFKDYEVNYWLFGTWAKTLAIHLTDAETGQVLWRLHYLFNDDGPDLNVTQHWLDNGYGGVFTNTTGEGIPGIAPAVPPPVGAEGKPMFWYVGTLFHWDFSGTD